MEPKLVANLTPLQTQVALSLAAGSSLSTAAQTHELSRTTIYSWLSHDSSFASAVEDAKAEFAAVLSDQLRDASIKALATLTAVLDDPKAPAGVRVKAALAILNRSKSPNPGWTIPETIHLPHSAPVDESREPTLDELLNSYGTNLNNSEQQFAHSEPPAKSEPIRVDKVGRNEPCPCGSTRKFKHCCLNVHKSQSARI